MALSKYQMFGLVRDKDGKPKVDNPADLHPVQLGMMTDQERNELGVWSGSWARDARGYKKITVSADGKVTAHDDLIAVSELFILPDDGSGATMAAVNPRCDVKAGNEIPGVIA